MNEQMLLPVSNGLEKYNPYDFIFSECNNALQEIIDNLPRSSGVMPYKNIMLICGDELSGKTHFCNLFASKVGAKFIKPGSRASKEHVILDDIDTRWGEEDLFHIFNDICELGHIALFTAKDFSKFALPDLKSRISSVRLFKIGKPDDFMLRALLTKHLASRNINVSEDVIKYLMVRIPRNFQAIFQAIDEIDKLALEKKRNINVSFLAGLFNT